MVVHLLGKIGKSSAKSSIYVVGATWKTYSLREKFQRLSPISLSKINFFPGKCHYMIHYRIRCTVFTFAFAADVLTNESEGMKEKAFCGWGKFL